MYGNHRCRHHADYRVRQNNKTVGPSADVADCFKWDTGQRKHSHNLDTSYVNSHDQAIYGQIPCKCRPSCGRCHPQPPCSCCQPSRQHSCLSLAGSGELERFSNQYAQRCEEQPRPSALQCASLKPPKVKCNNWMSDNYQSQPANPRAAPGEPRSPCIPNNQSQPTDPRAAPGKPRSPCIPNNPAAFRDYCKAMQLMSESQNSPCYDPNVERMIKYFLVGSKMKNTKKQKADCLAHNYPQPKPIFCCGEDFDYRPPSPYMPRPYYVQPGVDSMPCPPRASDMRNAKWLIRCRESLCKKQPDNIYRLI